MVGHRFDSALVTEDRVRQRQLSTAASRPRARPKVLAFCRCYDSGFRISVLPGMTSCGAAHDAFSAARVRSKTPGAEASSRGERMSERPCKRCRSQSSTRMSFCADLLHEALESRRPALKVRRARTAGGGVMIPPRENGWFGSSRMDHLLRKSSSSMPRRS